MNSVKISEEQAIKLAELWQKNRGLNIKAAGPATFWSSQERPDIYNRDTWSVFFKLDTPPGWEPDHMILHVDAETGEVEATPIF